MVFNSWKKIANSLLDIVPVELAGRGRRIADPLYTNISDAVDDLYNRIKRMILNEDYVFFGHSLGATVSYHLAQRIRQLNMNQPKHLFVSGRRAPHLVRRDEEKYHLMDNERFKIAVLKLGGTPVEFFDHPQLIELFLPLLKNDFRIAETAFSLNQQIVPLNIDITVMLGKEDELTQESVHGWERHTDRICRSIYFEGGHFYLHDQAQHIIDVMASTLSVHQRSIVE